MQGQSQKPYQKCTGVQYLIMLFRVYRCTITDHAVQSAVILPTLNIPFTVPDVYIRKLKISPTFKTSNKDRSSRPQGMTMHWAKLWRPKCALNRSNRFAQRSANPCGAEIEAAWKDARVKFSRSEKSGRGKQDK